MLKLTLGIVDTAGPIYCYSFCIGYVYVVFLATTKTAPRALYLISHILDYPADFRQAEYYMDSSG